MSGLFGGRDPFDDPFFSRPFGSSRVFDSKVANNSSDADKSSGVVIEELDSDDEQTLLENKDNIDDVQGRNEQEKKPAGKVPVVEHPDNLSDENNTKNKSKAMGITRRDNDTKVKGPETQGMSFQRVTYGGINGAYYTASTTRKSGNDGAVLEESRRADTTTGEASHRISRGVHDKGHSVTRKLNVDGKVETMQTLHNLEEDELAGFEQIWKGTADKHLPGWKHGFANTGECKHILSLMILNGRDYKILLQSVCTDAVVNNVYIGESSGGGLATWSGLQPFSGAQFSKRDNDAGLRNRSNEPGGERPKKKVVNIPID